MNRIISFFMFLLMGQLTQAQFNANPSPSQLKALDMEYYLFAHFGPNTFTGKEWGHGDEKPSDFNPSSFDAEQWCKTAIAAGAKGIIITAKHHDGFCLWPSAYSTHTVKQSSWKNGKGDILKELSTACKKYGIKFGVYLSPWDRNHPQYGTPEYNITYVNMVKEIFATYGPIWEFWFDGANGEGPNGKRQVYDWPLFFNTIRRLSPTTLMFSDIGPDMRWIGNEQGIAGATNWNYLNTTGFVPGAGGPSTKQLNEGIEKGESYIVGECDVSIRNGWFYHDNDSSLKSPQQLFNLYLKSVGRNGNLLLNIPIDRRGRMAATDSISLVGFKKLRDNAFGKSVADFKILPVSNNLKRLSDTTYTIHVALKKSASINCLMLEEDITKGQSISGLSIKLMQGGKEVITLVASTIGHKRILTIKPQVVDAIQLTVWHNTRSSGLLKRLRVFSIDSKLIEK